MRSLFFAVYLYLLSLKSTYGGPEALDLEEDEDNQTISNKGHHPQEEKHDSKEVRDQRVCRREVRPVFIHNLHDIIWDPVSHFHPSGIMQVVLIVQVQT